MSGTQPTNLDTEDTGTLLTARAESFQWARLYGISVMSSWCPFTRSYLHRQAFRSHWKVLAGHASRRLVLFPNPFFYLAGLLPARHLPCRCCRRCGLLDVPRRASASSALSWHVGKRKKDLHRNDERHLAWRNRRTADNRTN